MPCDRNRKSYQTLDLGMNLCTWCPECHDTAIRDHKKSGQITMSPHINSRIYCPQQMRAINACFGLTQGVILNLNIIPLFFLLCLFIIFFFPIDLRLTIVCIVVGTTRYLFRRSYFFMILLYRRLLWRTGDVVKKIPITLYHRLTSGEHDEMTFSRRSLYFFILSSI